MRFESTASALVLACSTFASGCALGPESKEDTWLGHESAHGTVIRINHLYDDCWRATYEVAPEWSCDAADLDQFGIAEPAPGADSDSRATIASQDVLLEQALANAPQLETTTCDDLVEVYRDQARVAAEKQLTQEVTRALRACEPTTATGYIEGDKEVASCRPRQRNTGYWDEAMPSYDGGVSYSNDGALAASGGATSQAPPVTTQDAEAENYSSTNNQVAAVEEADYVKNDAGHVFVLTDIGVRVFDSWPVEETHQISVIPLGGRGRRLLLADDQLIVFSSSVESGFASNQGCTYGYECRAQAETGPTIIQVFDVSEPSTPVLVSFREFQAGYLAARRIDETIHLVLHSGSSTVTPHLPVDLRSDTASPRELREWQQSRRQEIVESAAALDQDAFLPALARGCDDALAAPGGTATSMITLASFRLGAPEAMTFSHIAADPGFVYASESTLYLATDGLGARSIGAYRAAAEDISMVHRFALTQSGSDYEGSAPIRGHVLNQFSMDEFAGVLRVASTSGWVPQPGVNSSVTTMGLVDGRLQRLGELTGLAPTEDIRSVRFDGDRAFVVTFKKTDPLFVFDLKDPEQPAVLGELKIPGFSTYMHPLDRDHLLAVGFDADDQGSFAYFQGIQIQMFDVSDLSDPQLLHKTVLGGRGSSSEALMNHLAFNYFPATKMLAMPVTLCDDGGGNGGSSGQLNFSGVIAFDVGLESGINERGRLSFGDPEVPRDYGSYGCFDWWSNSSSAVKRTIFFDDYLVALSDYELRAAQVDALSDLLVALPLVEGSTKPVSAVGSLIAK